MRILVLIVAACAGVLLPCAPAAADTPPAFNTGLLNGNQVPINAPITVGVDLGPHR